MKPTVAQIKKGVRRYIKVVEWSDKDGCYIGSAPPLIDQSCHGATEAEVIEQLQIIVAEWVETLLADGKSLPPSSAGRDLISKLQHVA